MSIQTSLENQINGSFSSRFLLELFRNSGYFAIVNILLEFLMKGSFNYLKEPDMYAIIIAVLVQAYFLSQWSLTESRHRFLGNLIAPAIYTSIELLLEGADPVGVPAGVP